MLYELTAGRLPFQGPTASAVSSAILRDAASPLPADMPSSLRAVVARCLEKRPEDRYQDAGEVRAALEDLQTKTAPASPFRTWAAWAAAAVAVAALAVAAWIFVRPGGGTAERRTSSGAPASANQEANDAFELAMQFGRIQNDLARSTEMLERAIALDPHFAEARRSHAFNYILALLNELLERYKLAVQGRGGIAAGIQGGSHARKPSRHVHGTVFDASSPWRKSVMTPSA